jgi:hypothetical protein
MGPPGGLQLHVFGFSTLAGAHVPHGKHCGSQGNNILPQSVFQSQSLSIPSLQFDAA